MLSSSERCDLISVARGRADPDLVLSDARLINVLTREVTASDIAIRNGRIAYVGPSGERDWSGAARESLGGKFVSSGFIDPHVHVESSFLTLLPYARAAMARGVTTVAIDPHEIGNVLGVPGMRLLLEEAKSVPLRVRLRVPGRIPAMPAWLETSGAELDLSQTIDMLDWPEAVCLAGDINPQLLISADPDQLAKIEAATRRRMTVAGQSPGLSGAALNAYVAAGPEDSHVAASVDEIVENQRLGLRSIIALRRLLLHRPEFRELGERIRAAGLETRYLQFCTDDVAAHELVDVGHLDARIAIAIEEGVDPFVAYQMATINVAEGLRIDRDMGAICPGRLADLAVIGDMKKVDVEATMIGGAWVHGPRAPAAPGARTPYPAWARQTMRIGRTLTADDMRITVAAGCSSASVRTIRATTPKGSDAFDLAVENGVVMPDPGRGVSSIVVVDRHRASGRIGRGFVNSVYVERGALASTVSHDAHNLMVIGADHADMAVAANRAVEIGGGFVLALDGEVIAELPLPVAGLMSEAPAEQVAEGARQLVRQLHDRLGAPRRDDQILHHIIFLPLPNIPSFGFTDFGLISSDTLEVLGVM